MIEKIKTIKVNPGYENHVQLGDKINEIIDTVNAFQNPAAIMGKKRWHDVSKTDRSAAAKKAVEVRWSKNRTLKVKHEK